MSKTKLTSDASFPAQPANTLMQDTAAIVETTIPINRFINTSDIFILILT